MTRDQIHNTLRYVREQLADERGEDYSGVMALDMVLEELEQEPCDDAISRQDAIDAIWDGTNMDIYTREVKETLEELPSVEQEPKTGHWIEHDWEDMREKGYYRCSVCGTGYQRFVKGIRKSDVPYIDGQEYTLQNIDNYCPNCGARM